jgi:hypothetical protein
MLEPLLTLIDMLAKGAVLGTFGALNISSDRKEMTTIVHRLSTNLDRNNTARRIAFYTYFVKFPSISSIDYHYNNPADSYKRLTIAVIFAP